MTISSRCPHNRVNFNSLAAEIGLVVWGTAANFNEFRFLAALLQRRGSTDANQTLHGVWTSPVLVRYVYIFGGSCPVTEFCQVQNRLCILPNLALSYFGSVTARHLSSAREPNFAALNTYIRQGDHHVGHWPTF